MQGEAWDWFVQPNLIGKRKKFSMLNNEDVRILRKSIEREKEQDTSTDPGIEAVLYSLERHPSFIEAEAA